MFQEGGVHGIGTPRALMDSAFYCNGRRAYVLTANTQTMPVWNICQDILGHEHYVNTLLNIDCLVDSASYIV